MKDTYPIPRIDDTLKLLEGSAWFTTLDLASGYWQISLDDDAKQKSAFVVRGGFYQWKVMAFGLCNALLTFERLHWKILLVYVNDVIVFAKTFEDEMKYLEMVFQRFHKANLKLKDKKCVLFKKEVHFWAMLCPRRGWQPTLAKAKCIKDRPTPTKQTEVRTFLGLAYYYRRFIKGFAQVTRPLHQLTEKSRIFHWTLECKEAFQYLKDRLIEAPILGYPQKQGIFVLDTDASSFGLGGTLSQIQDGEEKVILYAS